MISKCDRPFNEDSPGANASDTPAGRSVSRKLVSNSKSHDWPALREFVRLAPRGSERRARAVDVRAALGQVNRYINPLAGADLIIGLPESEDEPSLHELDAKPRTIKMTTSTMRQSRDLGRCKNEKSGAKRRRGLDNS